MAQLGRGQCVFVLSKTWGGYDISLTLEFLIWAKTNAMLNFRLRKVS